MNTWVGVLPGQITADFHGWFGLGIAVLHLYTYWRHMPHSSFTAGRSAAPDIFC